MHSASLGTEGVTKKGSEIHQSNWSEYLLFIIIIYLCYLYRWSELFLGLLEDV